MDVKIVKSCTQQPVIKEPEAVGCEEFNFEAENFLKAVDRDILFIDDSIKLKNEKICEIKSTEPRQSPPICFSNVPLKLNEQMSLPIDNVKDLSFYESFIMLQVIENDDIKDVDDVTDVNSADEIGSACLMVDELSDGNILVFTIQQAFSNNERMLHESLSVVTKDLKLIHEKRIERKCSDSLFMENSLFIIPTDTGYRLTKSITHNDNTTHWTADVEWTKCGNFLCIGANVLMTRKLILENFKGCIQSYTCDIDGHFALTQHWFHAVEMKFIHNHSVTVKRLDQLMITTDEKIEKVSCFFLAQTGQLLKQIFGSNNYFVHMNPLDIDNTFTYVNSGQQKYTKHLRDNWQKDVQMMSLYLEHKARRKDELRRKFESPHVRLMLNNYVDSLIKCKPKSIMNFTVEFMRKLERNANVNVQLQILKTIDRRAQQN